MKSKNGKILDVGCNITVTRPGLEGLNAFLTKAYSAPTPDPQLK